MTHKPAKELRCAIYTRKSTEHGLELEFNSLDAQREACEAYVKSQASEGWKPLPKRYDDPAYSGGNMDRPALQHLLKDIDAGLIDVVVVYKIDRLTRSLADFAKLVEVFDAKTISFVAVTQQFNTTTSMGRLTLNVLLSFAQFERELSSERVRDKVAASRKKGKWTGGSVPLGYDSKDKKLIVNQADAKTVRMIFNRYLALKSLQRVIDELNAQGIVTKRRPIGGRVAGGITFTYGPLAYLLKNRTYLGEMGHAGKWFAGEHEPIIDRATFEQVQEQLKSNSAVRTGRRQQTGALLTSLIYDDRGNRMSPSYSVKNGIRYPFYVSSAHLRGRRAEAGSVSRISATDIDRAVLIALRTQAADETDPDRVTPRELIERAVERIVVQSDRLAIALKESPGSGPLEIPWSTPVPSKPGEINERASTARVESDPALVQALVRAHVWLKLLSDGTHDSIEDLATAIDLHPKVIRNRIRLAFLSPALTRSILSGEGSGNLSLAELNGVIPFSWHMQQHQ